MKRFMKTYVKKLTDLCRPALGICEGARSLVNLQVQCMNAKVRGMIDLSGIYIEEKATSGKIPA